MYDTDPLDAARLRELLITPDGLWQQIRVVAETGSTNADLVELARCGAASPGTALLTDNQSRGRGRLDRGWSAPPGTSLAMSLLVMPSQVPMARWSWLPLLAGMATSEAIRRATGVPAVLKWPNDVLVADRKLCGILAETTHTPAGPACVIGIGTNIDLTEDQLPVPWATSLAQAGASTRNKTTIAATVLQAFALLYETWSAQTDDAEMARSYVARCVTVGRQVRAVLDDHELVGRAEAVDEHGLLVLQTDHGRETISAADIVHLR